MYLDNLKTSSDVDGHFLTFLRKQIEGVDIKLGLDLHKVQFFLSYYEYLVRISRFVELEICIN